MLVLISLLAAVPSCSAQDEIVRTGPPAVTATARQDCMFGGQPVACPQPVSVTNVPFTAAAPETEDEDEDDNPWNSVLNANFENTTTNRPSPLAPPEGGYSRSRGNRGTASYDANAPQPTTPARPRVFVSDPNQNGNRISAPASEGVTPTQGAAPRFNWSAGAENVASRAPYPAAEYTAGFYTANGASADSDAVPQWAFGDPDRYELDQCGPGTSEPSAQCRRNARNRLASARAEAAVSSEPTRDAAQAEARGSGCRTVNEPARDGMPASSSLVCGNGDTEALLSNMRERATRVMTPGW